MVASRSSAVPGRAVTSAGPVSTLRWSASFSRKIAVALPEGANPARSRRSRPGAFLAPTAPTTRRALRFSALSIAASRSTVPIFCPRWLGATSGPKRSAWSNPGETSTPAKPTTSPSISSTKRVSSGGTSQSESSLSSSSAVVQRGLPTCSCGFCSACRESSSTAARSPGAKLRRLLPTEDPRSAHEVIEAGDPGQCKRDEAGPPCDVGAERSACGEPCNGSRGGLRPGLQLPQIARGQHDAALERGEAQPGHEELARDDRG